MTIHHAEKIAAHQVFREADHDALLPEDIAAHVLATTQTALEAQRLAGKAPPHVHVGRRPAYRKRDLVAHIKQLAGEGDDDSAAADPADDTPAAPQGVQRNG